MKPVISHSRKPRCIFWLWLAAGATSVVVGNIYLWTSCSMSWLYRVWFSVFSLVGTVHWLRQEYEE